jgi:hypothetical protein
MQKIQMEPKVRDLFIYLYANAGVPEHVSASIARTLGMSKTQIDEEYTKRKQEIKDRIDSSSWG